MTGGRGKKRLEMSQLNMSQLGLRGGRVKLIETMSQNLQFFFLAGFPKAVMLSVARGFGASPGGSLRG